MCLQGIYLPIKWTWAFNDNILHSFHFLAFFFSFTNQNEFYFHSRSRFEYIGGFVLAVGILFLFILYISNFQLYDDVVKVAAK